LEEARSYVDRRNDFARNEKAELLLQIKNLERRTAEAEDREQNLRAEFREAIAESGSAGERVEEANREAQRWKKEAIEHATRLKRADSRLQQLEQKHLDDKARIKALAEQLKLAAGSDVSAGKGRVADSISEAPLKVALPHKDHVGGSTKQPAPSPPKAVGTGAPPSNKRSAAPASQRLTSAAADAQSKVGSATPLQMARTAASLGGTCLRSSWHLVRHVAAAARGAHHPPSNSSGGGKKGRKAAHVRDDALEASLAEVTAEYRQRQVLGALVVLIVTMAAAKLWA